MNTNVVEETTPMEPRPTRRSDRISLGLRIRVSGVSGLDREFAATTRTLLVSRHGAKILLDHDLVPHGELNVGCLNTNQEADARLVGFMGEEAEGPSYGIEFLDRDVNLWNIAFPPLEESDNAVARTLLRCRRCGTTELAYLNETEAIIFQFRDYGVGSCSLVKTTLAPGTAKRRLSTTERRTEPVACPGLLGAASSVVSVGGSCRLLAAIKPRSPSRRKTVCCGPKSSTAPLNTITSAFREPTSITWPIAGRPSLPRMVTPYCSSITCVRPALSNPTIPFSNDTATRPSCFVIRASVPAASRTRSRGPEETTRVPCLPVLTRSPLNTFTSPGKETPFS